MKKILHFLLLSTASILIWFNFIYISAHLYYSLIGFIISTIYFLLFYIFYFCSFKKHNATKHFIHVLLTYSKTALSTTLISILATYILRNECDFDTSSENISKIILLLSNFILLSINIKLCSTLYNIRSQQKYDTTLPPLSIKQKILSTYFLLIFSLLPIISVLLAAVILDHGHSMCHSLDTFHQPIEATLPATTEEPKPQTDTIKKDDQIITPSEDKETPPPPAFYEFTIKDGKIKQVPIGKTED